MAQLIGREEIESIRNELSEIGRSLRRSSFRSNGEDDEVNDDVDEDFAVQWAAIERLPTFERLRSCLYDEESGEGGKKKSVIDVTKLGAVERRVFIEKLIKHIEHDNLLLLQKIRKRIDK